MKIQDCEFKRLLPMFMREEADNIALAEAIDPIIREIGILLPLCSDWENTERLPEEFLDALAKELDIDWYKLGGTLEAKRNLVQNSDLVHMHIGTKSAVEMVVKDYYGGAEVKEWFEYNGQPGHFRIEVDDEHSEFIYPEELAALVKKVKKASAILDDVDFVWTTYETIYAGVCQMQTWHLPDQVINTGM